MNRRDVIKTAGVLLGYSLTAGTAAAVLGGCSADPTPGWEPQTLTEDQVRVLEKLADVIIPGTDSLPGAKDVNIAKFMDERLSLYASDEDKQTFQDGYKSFTDAHQVNSMSADDLAALIKAELESETAFVKTVHEQSITGFCTSEKGMKEVLIFKPIPTEQRGCVPLEEVGGIWAI